MVGMTAQLDFHSAIQQMLAPYVLAVFSSPGVSITREFGGPEVVQIDAPLKPTDLPEQPTDRQVRTALMESANRVIDLLENFGFRPFGTAPTIEFSGRILHSFDKDPRLVTEGRISLTLLPPQ